MTFKDSAYGALVALAFASLVIANANAAPLNDYSDLVKARSVVAPLGPSLFGDKTDPYTGQTEFSNLDVDVPGNNELPVSIARRFTYIAGGNRPDGLTLFADWVLDIPHMHGVFAADATANGWKVSTSGFPNKRCSVDTSIPSLAQPPAAVGTNNQTFQSYHFWYGNNLYVPGKGDQRMMVISPANPNRPSAGGPYYWTTKDNWVFSCLSTTANGAPGEGYLATSPDGIKYWFNWFAKRAFNSISMDVGTPPFSTTSTLSREEVFILPTKLQDRFGNEVTYSYDAANPLRLTNIASSDGRAISLAYNSSGNVSTVSTNGRTWTYEYGSTQSPPIRSTLTGVVLPDASRWTYQFDSSIGFGAATGWRNCADLNPPSTSTVTKSLTHPSGAIGQFTFALRRLARSYVPKNCMAMGNATSPFESYVYDSISLDSKVMSGPGISPQQWIMQYGPNNFSWSSDCISSPCAATRLVTATEPDGTSKRSTFSNKYGPTEGLLQQVEWYDSSSNLKRTETYSYVTDPAGQPYPQKLGTIPCYRCDKTGETPVPRASTSIAQDGVKFLSSTTSFDLFARPQTVVRWSELATPGTSSYSKADAVEYHDDLPLWVLGQAKRTTTSGIETSKTEFGWKALPWKTYSFGKLQKTLAYDTTSTVASGQLGTLKTVTDGNNNVATLTSWKRGIPQSIKYPVTAESPTGAIQSAEVHDAGWITSVTDENGYKTCYGYDPMGRVNLITHPSETTAGVCDASAWTRTSISFTATGNAAAYGMPAGHWRQTTLTGNGRKILIFDALWRPVVEQTLDLGNVSGTLSEVIKRYDTSGRVEFQSYPMNTNGLANYADTTLKGIWTDYDALDRVTSVTQDSELGLLTTLTEYLTGFKTRVTPPKGAAWQTTTSYQAYDQPSYDMPVAITHPEGAFTDITRDVFGKPTVLKRRNSASSLVITRSYAYNANQELCRSVEPETGATLIGYDTAGNLKWSASGLPAATACEANGTSTAVAARRADRTFDARNRVKSLSFPNGLGNTTYAYAPDGLPSSIVTNNGATDGQATLNYAYNKRRLITRETLITPQLNWLYDYGYNANGHLAVNNWHGLNIDYAPNALGQPTKAGPYASGVSYYPNGAIKQFTYGNGIVHTMTQNARQLPSRSTDSVTGSKPLDLGYAYDKNSNVSGVTDYVTGARQTRGMTYDNLDRLTQTTSSMFGTATYGYNVLDNLTTVNVAGGNKARNHAYVYDANNRLANVTTGVGGPTVIGLGYDVQGNLANKSGVLYSFDYGNRLRTATDPVGGKTSTYAYDGLGRRVKDVVNSLPKHSQYTQNGQLVMVGDERATDVSEYVYLGGSLLAIRERDVPTAAYTTKYLHTDALGTPIAMTSQSRTLLETSEYEPFGQQVNVVGAPKDGPGYTGHVQDAATGLTYMQQRYYDPGIGRFLSVDPVTANGTSGANFNRYWYANNNPYKFTDPDGRESATLITQHPMQVNWTPEMVERTQQIGSVAYSGGLVGALRAVAALFVRQEIKSEQAKGTEASGQLHAPGDVQDDTVIARGGTGDAPEPGTQYSGSQGSDAAEAGKGVPNGQMRTTTAGEIRANGGSVEVKPEASRQGNMNGQHVNVKEGGSKSSLGPVQPNPAPKPERIK